MKKYLRIKSILLGFLIFCSTFAPAAICAQAEEAPIVYDGLYLHVLDAVQNNMPDERNYITVDMTGMTVTLDDARAAVNAIVRLNPEYFYITGGISYYSDGDGHITGLMLACTCHGEDLTAARAEFDALTAPLFALRDDSWSDPETVLFYHDYLAYAYEYDTDYVIKWPMEFLETGRGVCNAYALTFQLLMNRFGIPCIFAESRNINHIWNVVYLDGAWYHIDVTHDDPTPDRPGAVRHKYFLTGSETTSQLKPNATDTIFGGQISVSDGDHPLCALLADCRTPAVNVGGGLYTVTQTASGYALCRFYAANSDFVPVFDMPSLWTIPNSDGYFYPGCYTTLVSLGKYIFYYDETTVRALDTGTFTSTDVTSCGEDERIYGMRLVGDILTAYLAAAPGSSSYTPMPVFKKGDTDGDFDLSITDVTVLIDALGDAGGQTPHYLADIDGNGSLQIADVTALLDLLTFD